MRVFIGCVIACWILGALASPSLAFAAAEGAPAARESQYGFGMGPPSSPAIVAAAAAAPIPAAPGPFQPAWDSLKQHYQVPQWFREGKFGLFLHWGLYAVPAYHNEWYEKHMYGAFADWHARAFGPQDRFGYKDFIPLFKAEKFDADAWAGLFAQSGARYVVPTAEHHDGFSLWAMAARWSSRRTGPDSR